MWTQVRVSSLHCIRPGCEHSWTLVSSPGPVVKSHRTPWSGCEISDHHLGLVVKSHITPGSGCQISHHISPPGSSCKISDHCLGPVVKSHSTLWTWLSNVIPTCGRGCYIPYHYLGPVITTLTIKWARERLHHCIGPSHHRLHCDLGLTQLSVITQRYSMRTLHSLRYHRAEVCPACEDG